MWLQRVGHTTERLSLHLNYYMVCAKSLQLFCLTLCDPMDWSRPGSSIHGILQARILEWVAFPFSRDLPNPGIKPRSPTSQVDFMPSELPRKPKNTGVDSLFLLQGIFLTDAISLLCVSVLSGNSIILRLLELKHRTVMRDGQKNLRENILHVFQLQSLYTSL